MHPVIELLVQARPAELTGLALLARLRERPPGLAKLIGMGPEIEAGLVEMDRFHQDSRGVIERCLSIRAIPSQTNLPPGF